MLTFKLATIQRATARVWARVAYTTAAAATITKSFEYQTPALTAIKNPSLIKVPEISESVALIEASPILMKLLRATHKNRTSTMGVASTYSGPRIRTVKFSQL